MPDGTANLTRINSQAAGARKRRRSLGVMALEPRVMYDAAAGAAIATTLVDPTHAADSTTATAPSEAANVAPPAVTGGEILFTTAGSGAASRVEQIGVNGSSPATNPTDVVDGNQSVGTSGNLSGIVVDAARGKYFVAEEVVTPDGTNAYAEIFQGNLATGALDPTPIYVGPPMLDSTGTQFINGYISGLQLDAASGEIYFAQGVRDPATGNNDPAQTGIFKISEDGSGLAQVVSLPNTALDAPQNIALDLRDNLVFFTDNSGRGAANSDTLGIANLSTGATTFVSAADLAAVGVTNSTGLLSGIAVDPTNDMLYFTSTDTSHQDHNYIFKASFTVTGSGDTASATLGTIQQLYNVGSSGAPASIVLDVPDGLFYVANKTDKPDSGTTVSGSIEVGSLDGTQPLTTVFEASSLGLSSAARPVNLAFESTPTVTAGDSAAFIVGGRPVVADAGLTAADTSGQDLARATVTISGGALDGDTLTADISGTNIAWSYDSASHTLTLSGVDTPANYQRVLETVTFSSTNADPTNGGTDAQRTLSWSVTDGLLTSNTATSTVDIHRPPIVTAGDTATFSGGGSPVTLDGTLTVSDPDGTGMLSSATVTISSGFIANQDTLNFAGQNGISGTYDAATGTLTLTGTASVANYQAALDSITYSFNPANGDPTGGGGDTSRTITWTVNNGAASSTAVTSTLDAVHVAPTIGDVSSAKTFIAGGQAVTVESGLAVADIDSNNTLVGATVTISGGALDGDTLTADTSTTSITASFAVTNGVPTLTLSGNDTPANYQKVLDSIAFSSSSADPTNGGVDLQRSLTWTVNDGVATTSATSSVAVHTPPSIATDGDPTFIAGGSPVTLAGSLTVGDVDSTTLTTATVTISSGFLQGDTLAASTSGTTIAAAYDPATGTLTLSGSDTVAHYQQVLDSVVFSSTQADPTSGGTNTQRNLTWSVSDSLSSAAAASTVTVHTPPSISAGGTVTFVGGGQPVPLDGNVSVSDVDSTTLSTATVKISSGFLSGDALNFTNQNGITGNYDAVHGVLTLTGTTTLANYQKALESITYSFTAGGDPTQGGNTIRTVSWSVNDGVADSVSATSTVSTVNAVHTPPTVAGAGNTMPYSKHGPAAVVDGALTLSDPDSGGMLSGATVTISSGFLSGDTLAAVTTNTGITASYNASTGALTLTGQDTIAHYQSVLDSVTYSSTNNNPSQGNKDTTRTITWVVNDGATSHNLSTPVTSTIDLTPGQSVVHAPHGNNAAAVVTSSAAAPMLDASTPVTYVVPMSQLNDGDDRDTAPAGTATQSRGERDDHAAVDLRHAVVATDAELLAARRGQGGGEARHPGEGGKPAHGKPGLLAQLKAAGRHGVVHERQALIKDLHKRSAAH